MYGKLKKTLNSPCPECGTLMQVRTMPKTMLAAGETVTIDQDITICPECGYEKKDGHQHARDKIGFRIKESYR